MSKYILNQQNNNGDSILKTSSILSSDFTEINTRSAIYNNILYKGKFYCQTDGAIVSTVDFINYEDVVQNNVNVEGKFKVLNDILFSYIRSSSKLYIVDVEAGSLTLINTTYGYSIADMTYLNGYYYILCNNKHILKSSNLITFEDFDLSSTLTEILYSIESSGSYIYCIEAKGIYVLNAETLTLSFEKVMFGSPRNGGIQSYLYKGNIYILYVYASQLWGHYMTAIIYNIESNSFVMSDSFNYTVGSVSEWYSVPWYSLIGVYFDKANNIALFNSGAVLNDATTSFIYNNINNPSYMTNSNITNFRTITSVYRTLKPTINGSHFNYEVNSSDEIINYDNGEYYCNEDSTYTINITVENNYKILSITSEKGTVSFNDDTGTITYNSSLGLYINDTITVNVEYNIYVEPDDYELPQRLTLAENFVSSLTSGYTVNDGKYFNIKYIKVIDNKLYYNGNYDGSTIDIDLLVYDEEFKSTRYLILESRLSSISGEFYNILMNFATILPYVNKNIVLNITKDEHTNYNINGGYEMETGGYFNPKGMSISFTFNQGYYYKSLTTNYGTILLNTVTLSNIVLPYGTVVNIVCESKTGSFRIVLYQLEGESKIVDKTSVLSLKQTLTGNLRSNCSIQNPVISVQTNSIPNYNYAYISDFNRYYYITDITNVGYNLWQLTMKCDVLMSFKTDIKDSTLLVLRNQNNYDIWLEDKLEPLQGNATTYEIQLANKADPYSVPYRTFYTENLNSNEYYVIINLVAKDPFSKDAYLGENIHSENNVLPNVDKLYSKQEGVVSYGCTVGGAYELLKLLNDKNKQSYYVNATMYPFIVSDNTDEEYSNPIIKYNQSGPITIDGTTTTNSYGKIVGVPEYITLCEFTINETFLRSSNINIYNYLGYRAKYELYIPYLGWTMLDANQILGRTLQVVYSFDLVSSSNYVSVIDITQNKLLFKSQTNIGIKLPISFDSSKEVSDKEVSIVTSGAFGMTASALTGLAGFATGNPFLMAGGAVGFAKSFTNGIENMMFNYTKANATIGSGYDGIYSPQLCRIRITYQPSYLLSNTDKEKYCELFGKPLNRILKLSTLTGFTVVSNPHLIIPIASKQEIDEAEELLTTGIIL